MSITLCLLIPGWIPQTSPVNPPEIEIQRPGGPEGTIVGEDDGPQTEIDENWMIDYRAHAFEAMIAGVLMAMVSRISHILAKPGVLRHEAYMSMYAYFMSLIIMPLFIIMGWWRFEYETRTLHKLD